MIKLLEVPRSFMNIIPEDLRASILTLPEHYLNVDEEQLLASFPEDSGFKLSPVLEALRTNFWMEHDRVVNTRHELMTPPAVYLGVCPLLQWSKYLNHPESLAYILCRPPQYAAMMGALSNQWVKRLRDILNIPVKKPNGEYQDPRLLEILLKAGAMVDLRTQGGYIARSETRNLTYLETKNKTESVTKILTNTTDTRGKTVKELEAELDDKLKLLEQNLSAPSIAKTPEPMADGIVDAEFTEVKK